MAQVNSDVVALQLEKVIPLVPAFYEVEDALISKFEKIQTEDQSSRDLRMPIQIRPGGQFRQVSFDGGDLGTGSGTRYAVATMSPIDQVIAFEYTKKVEYTTNSKTKAVANAVQKLVADAMVEFKTHKDRSLQTAGQNVIGQMAIGGRATSGANTVCTLNATAATFPFGAQLMRFGQKVQIHDSTLATYRGTVEINGIDYVNNTISFLTSTEPAGNIQNSDKFTVEGTQTAPAGGGLTPGVGIFGLPYHHNNSSSGTWLTLTRSAYPEVITPSVNASSGSLTTTYPQILTAKIEMALGQDVFETGSWLWCLHPKQHVAWLKLMNLISEITLPMGGGGNGQVDLLFNRRKQRTIEGIPVMPSINADPTRIDCIDTKNWVRGTYKETSMLVIGGLTKLPKPSSGSWYSADMFYIGNSEQIGCKNPRRGGYIYSLAIPTGF